MQILRRLPEHLAEAIVAAADGTLADSLRNLPECFHSLVLCAHFPSIVHDRVLDLAAGAVFKHPPGPVILQALFTATATFKSLRELHVGSVGALNATEAVVASFRQVLQQCSALSVLSVHGGRRNPGFLTDSVALVIASCVPDLPQLEELELNTTHRPAGGQLSAKSVDKVLAGLASCSSLKKLTLTSIVCSQGSSQQPWPLAAALMQLPNLESLKLRGSLTATNLRGLMSLMNDLERVSLMELRELDISNNSLGDEGAMALTNVLKQLPTLKTLDVSENDITVHGAEDLATAFTQLHHLRVLNMMDNRFADPGTEVLSASISALTNMETLDVSFCDMSVDGSAHIASAIAHFHKLQHLNMAGCKLSARFWERRPRSSNDADDECSGARALGEALGQHSNLQQLSLMGTQINSDAMTLLAPALAGHQGLTSLDLQFNVQLGSRGISSFSEHMTALTDLQCLRLSCFDVSTDAATEFSASLGSLTSLKRLGLLGFHTSEDGAIAVVSALSSLSRMEELQVMSIGMSEVAAAALAEALRNMVRMKNLHMDNNPLGDVGAGALAPALSGLRNLQWVTMASTGMTAQGAAAIVTALDQHTSMERCTVSISDADSRAQLPQVLRRPWVLIY